MHFLEVLTTEEHYKHKILAELRGDSRLSKKMISGGNWLANKRQAFPRHNI